MTVTPGWRQAALVLHAMQPGDRDWLLERLSVEERERLSSLLGELRELGIPAEPDLLHACSNVPPVATDKLSKLSLEAAIELMQAVSPAAIAQIAQIMRHEPAALVVSFLNIAVWPWKEEMLSQLGVVKRRQVEELSANSTACPAKLAHAILIPLLPRVSSREFA